MDAYIYVSRTNLRTTNKLHIFSLFELKYSKYILIYNIEFDFYDTNTKLHDIRKYDNEEPAATKSRKKKKRGQAGGKGGGPGPPGLLVDWNARLRGG